jgi:hypothetical protein
MRQSIHAAFTIAIVALSACGGSSSGTTTPTAASFSIAGSWIGSVVDNIAGTGVVRATIDQSGSTVSGTWSATYQNAIDNNSGTFTGDVSGNTVKMTLRPSLPNKCSFAVTATTDGSSISGTYAALSCSIAVNGTINVRKQ